MNILNTDNVMINLFIVDKQTSFIKGIRATFEKEENNIKIVGSASTYNKAMDFINKNDIQVLLFDPSINENLNGNFFKQIKELNSEIKIIILTNELDINYLNNLWNIGVDGIELKNCGKRALIQTIKSVLEGNRIIGKNLPDFIYESKILSLDEPAKLSFKEKEIYSLINNGSNCEEIANKLKLPLIAVQFHYKNILKKLNKKTSSKSNVGIKKQYLFSLNTESNNFLA